MKGIEFDIFIGLSDITDNQRFRWVDGTAVDYTNWNRLEPNEAGGEVRKPCSFQDIKNKRNVGDILNEYIYWLICIESRQSMRLLAENSTKNELHSGN